jgi:ABC-2 type transport system ATP-binding protein
MKILSDYRSELKNVVKGRNVWARDLALAETVTSAIEIKKLEKVYSSKVKALNGIDFDVNAWDIFALLSSNGSGKTTFMWILTTQIKPTSGEAFIFGFDVIRKDGEVRKRISYVPQETSVLTDISGFENLLIYAKI